MLISCEQYEAPCSLSSVGLEHCFYTAGVTRSNRVESTVNMVFVAQSEERWFVVPEVVGS